MDNATHTLVGVLLGEAAARLARPERSGLAVASRRNLFVTLLAVGSNLPDADLALTLFGGDRLGYLLQHRGYTHTVVGAVAGAALLLAGCATWLRWRRLSASRTDYAWLAGLALLGPLLHLAMDFSNSYGVHPFWPFFNGWLYGDSVFIVEPLLWACAAPLVFILRTPLARVLLAALIAAGLAAPWYFGLAGAGPALGLALLTAGMLAIGRWWRPGRALAAAILAWAAVTAVFAAASHRAAQRLDALAVERFPHALTLDRVLGPAPENPLCWDVLLVQLEAQRYTVRHAALSLAPALLPPAQCRGRALPASSAVPFEPVPDRGASFLSWYGQFTAPRQELAALAAGDCNAAAFFKFARAPWIVREQARWLLGDLRFGGGGPRPGFAELVLSGNSQDCRGYAAPWLAPRAELLN